MVTAGITPGDRVSALTAGPDGNVWFTSRNDGVPLSRSTIGRITPGGAVTEFKAGVPADSGPLDIEAGSDGTLWFTGFDRVLRNIIVEGHVNDIRTFPEGHLPAALALGDDGAMWYGEFLGGIVGRIGRDLTVDALGSGLITVNSVPSIAAGTDDSIWFAGSPPPTVGRVTATGDVQEFSVGISPTSTIGGIAAVKDGNIWFTEGTVDRVARITPSGVVTEFEEGITRGGQPSGITAGPDGNMWFAESGAKRVARITPDGQVTEFPIDAAGGTEPNAIAAGPDGNIWFSAGVSRIGRLSLQVTADRPVVSPPPIVSPPQIPVPVSDVRPRSKILRFASSAKASRFVKIAGTATDDHGVRRVDVAVSRRVRVRGKIKCQALAASGKIVTFAPAAGKACRPRFVLHAVGTTHWTLKFKRPLTRGTWSINTRAVDTSGRHELAVGASRGNLRTIRLR